MGAFRWLFGDIASVVAPAVDRGPRAAPTRRSARWLIGIGIFVTLFGAIGVAAEAGTTLERQDATVVKRYTTHFYTRTLNDRLHYVRLRLDNGDTANIRYYPLYRAVGTRTELPVKVDVDPDINRVHAVYVDGRRFDVGRQSTAWVIVALVTALGVFLLLRGIGRLRRARLVGTGDAAGPDVTATPA